MTALLSTFHFLRPFWLLALVPACTLIILIRNRHNASRAWRGVIADHLLKYLLVERTQQKRLQPWHLLATVWLITIFALAGPSWQQEPSPFTEDTAALFIVIKVTPSMKSKDVQPSRLERGVHKIQDLLALRQGSLNGLIAYSGSAHLVMPLTRDGAVITTFAQELSPEIMPVDGDAAVEAITLAENHFKEAGISGSILLIADQVPADLPESLFPVQVLAIATENDPLYPLDQSGMEKAARSLGGTLALVTPDDQDITAIADRVEKAMVTTALEDGGQRWKDAGYWVVPVVAVLCLAWFRRGWVVQYE
jgi:Ca-activated chloride channel family protein